MAGNFVRLRDSHPKQQHRAPDPTPAEPPQHREPREQLVHDHRRREHEVIAVAVREVRRQLAIGAPVRAQHAPELLLPVPAGRIGAVPVAGLEQRVDRHGPLEPAVDVRVGGDLDLYALRLVPLRDSARVGEPVSVVILERFLDDQQARAGTPRPLHSPPPRASRSR